MKKVLALTTICLLSLSTFLALGPQVLAPAGFQASYSTNVPTINGWLSSEWNDANSYLIVLSGVAGPVNAAVYFKHDGTNIYFALKVFAADHDFDEFVVFFDEGNDGGYGSGTGDGVLTPNQEDLKECYSPSISNFTREDGCYKGAWYAYWGGDFAAACGYVVDHWECEFSIPFVGVDEVGPNDVKEAILDDVSDLVCGVTDIVGIKIQYFTQPDAKNYFYPAGDQYQIATYTTLSFESAPFVPPGDNVIIHPDPEDTRVSLTFEHILTPGTISMTKTAEPPAGVPELTYILGFYYDFEVTFTFSGAVMVSVPYGLLPASRIENELTLWHCEGPIVGDVDSDGEVELEDLQAIKAAMGTRPGSQRWNPACDLNSDGKVNRRDLLSAQENLGLTSWVDITTGVDTENNIVFGVTSSFPPFGIR